MYQMIQDPEIDWVERTGYPSWMQERDEDGDEDDYFDHEMDEEDWDESE